MSADRSALSAVIAGLVPAIQPSARSLDRWRPHTGQQGIQIDPVRVFTFDQVALPHTRPLLHSLLALDRLAHQAKLLIPDQQMHAIFTGEARRLTLPVLLDAPDDVVGNANVERSSGFAGEYIDPVAAHDTHTFACGVCGLVDRGDKPRDDTYTNLCPVIRSRLPK